MKELLAHSARSKLNIPAQTYKEHVGNVIKRAKENAEKVADFLSNGSSTFMDVVWSAACLHDLGKLDIDNQAELNRPYHKSALPVNHVDAGTVRLFQLNRWESALLVYGHHVGLCSIPGESAKGKELFLRDERIWNHTKDNLDNYKNTHEAIIDNAIKAVEIRRSHWSGLTRRIALSCLVDADFGDTAQHYNQELIPGVFRSQWEKRLQALDSYEESLFNQDPSSARNQLRREIYFACRNANIDSPIRACDSPVGTGKTTAILAHLLKVAASKNLRHIFVVLPFTNIIKQSVETYRKAVTLNGEQPDEIVAEHHHQADFSDLALRQLSTLWKSPIIVTTAVQFFETLAGNHPSKLRKLHELPGSAIFLDEAHAAIPSWLWPQSWLWLKELTEKWCCSFVLASGSLPSFWQLNKFVDEPECVPNLIKAELRQRSNQSELQRIRYSHYDKPLNRHELIDFVISKDGPRLLILNTVQSAAVVAKEMQKVGQDTLHLSTSLTPLDRERIIDRVLRLLKFSTETDWTLVATSCVEAGMDFSFRTAFRESCSTASLIQIGGRVNRHGKYEKADVWDFRVLDPLLNRHPSFETSRMVLDELFKENIISTKTSTDTVTEAMRREIMSDYDTKAEIIKKCERVCDYPEVARLYRIIDADTRIVVVDRGIIHALEHGEKISALNLLRNSVQIWSHKISKLALRKINGCDELYKWEAGYDPDFLGYMVGVLPLIYAQEEGLII